MTTPTEDWRSYELQIYKDPNYDKRNDPLGIFIMAEKADDIQKIMEGVLKQKTAKHIAYELLKKGRVVLFAKDLVFSDSKYNFNDLVWQLESCGLARCVYEADTDKLTIKLTDFSRQMTGYWRKALDQYPEIN